MQKKAQLKKKYMKVFEKKKIIFLSLCFTFLFLCYSHSDEQTLISNDQSDHLVWVRKQQSLFNNKTKTSTYTIYSKKSSKEIFSGNYTGDLQSLYLSDNSLYSVYPKSIQSLDLLSKTKKITRISESGFSFLGLVIQGNTHYQLAKKTDRLYTRLGDNPWKALVSIEKITPESQLSVFSYDNKSIIALMDKNNEGTVHTITYKNDSTHLSSVDFSELYLTNISLYKNELILIGDDNSLKLTNSNTMPYRLPTANDSSAKVLALASDAYTDYILYKDDENFYTQIGNHEEAISTPILSKKSFSRKGYFITQFAWTFFIIVSISLFISIRKKQQKLLNLPIAKPQTAHLLYRVLAFIIDIVILSPIVELINYTFFEDNLSVLAQFVIQYDQLQNDPEKLLNIIESNVPLFIPLIITHQVIFIIYHLFFDSIFNASLGKMFFQLKLVSENDSPLTPQQIFIKNIMRLFDYFLTLPIGFVFCLSSKSRQSLGDRIAKTTVISQRF